MNLLDDNFLVSFFYLYFSSFFNFSYSKYINEKIIILVFFSKIHFIKNSYIYNARN